MAEAHQQRSQVEGGRGSRITPGKGIIWGLVGGLAGTIVMDVVLFGASLLIGLPAVVSFKTIGDTAARLFSMFGVEMAGGVPLGAAMHYLLGSVFGAIFGAAVFRYGALRANTTKKGIALSVLYIEILSQPILAASPILLKMTTSETLQWFGVSAVMHLIWGVVLGIAVSYGLRRAAAAEGT
jgi:hypothetical protein